MKLSLRSVGATALTVVSLAAGLTDATAPAHADSTTNLASCAVSAAPCLQSITVDGAPRAVSATTFQGSVSSYATDGSGHPLTSHSVSFSSLPSDLGIAAEAQTWSVTVNLGVIPPRFVHGTGSGVTVSRAQQPDGTWLVTVTGHPATVYGACDMSSLPWTCPEADKSQATGFRFDVFEYHGYTGSLADDDKLMGMAYFNNVAADATDPQFRGGAMYIQVGNKHFQTDGVTPVDGHLEYTLPYALLRDWIGIPNPETMTNGSLSVISSNGELGTVTITQGTGAVLVTIEGMHFSQHIVTLKSGRITPAAPGRPRVKRSGTRAVLRFAAARPRGARVRGYRIACTGGVKATTRRTTVRLAHLVAGRSYTCRVQAQSKAGPSAWSKRVRV